MSLWHDVQPRGSLVRTMPSNSVQKWAYTLDAGTWSTAQKIISADCIKQPSVDRSSCAHSLKLMRSSKDLSCRPCSAAVCRYELTAEPFWMFTMIGYWNWQSEGYKLDVVTDGTRRTSQGLICADCVYQSASTCLQVLFHRMCRRNLIIPQGNQDNLV